MDEGPASDDRLLARYGRRFAPGTVVFREGEPSDVVFLLQSGRIRLFKQVGAMERSLRVVRPGDLFGELALLEGSRRQSTAVALDESLALAFDHATFHQVAQTNPDVGLRVIEQIVRRLRDAEDQIEILMVRDHQSKVVVALMKLAQRELANPEQSGGQVTLQISPLELSAQVGLDVEVVKRVVSQLRETGYVRIQDERVELSSLETLRELYSLLSIKDQLRGSPERDRGQVAR
ncbi:MAG TPA: Crp/Fnr family transcriptional regulator [Polyangiaceae bacterium]|nr:Crp/Fnr family transcriptional regulator [Polyangiaceae bacterium]